MRLTLRTLLAYMDEILEPADRDELAKKIETSEFANNLILRTKDTMRRLRLSAPQVVGTGIGLDPNTVAEYLDNVLPPDSVADFERICLESDVHLAEAASCHHVLTMVLGEPAEVDPVARQRMYAIPAEAERRRQLHIEPAHTTPVGVPVAAPLPPRYVSGDRPADASQQRGTAIPDYLRASSWSGGRLAWGAFAAALLIGIGMMILFGLRGWDTPEVAVGTDRGATTFIAPPPTSPNVAPPESPPNTAAEVGASGPATSQIAGAPPRLPLPGGPVAAETAPPVASAVESTGPVVGELPATPDHSADAVADDSGIAGPVPTTEAPPIPPPPNHLAGGAPAEAVSPPTVEETPRVASVDVEPTAATDTVESESPANVPELGTYLDGKNVLLRYDPTAEAWFRMTPRTMLHPGDRLLALPAFHPKLTLTSGLHVKLAGGTLVSLGNAPGGVPQLKVAYGRVVIVNTASGENSLQLTMGGTDANVRLMPNGTLALEVVPSYVPGSDPREAPSPTIVQFFARDGSVVWTDAAGSRTIESPNQWSIVEGIASAPSVPESFPDWIDHEPAEQRSEQLFGAPAVEDALDPTRPVEEQLLELYQSSPRREVKSLVARSSMFVGQFVPFVEALRDSDQKATWKTHIETLRSAMALGPESAEKIRQTLVEQRGEAAAADLYELLCGYGPDQIGNAQQFRAGLGSRLVDWMESDSLDYRVLAVQDMWEITGMRLMPNPAGTPTERARGIRIWRERLKSGEVEPLAPAQ